MLEITVYTYRYVIITNMQIQSFTIKDINLVYD